MRPSSFQLESILVADRTAALRRSAEGAPGRLRPRLGRLLVAAGLRLAPELLPSRAAHPLVYRSSRT